MTPPRWPVRALHVFVVGLALHNVAMALLWDVGIRGGALTVVAAWKEALLAAALAAVAWSAWRARRLPFRPGPVDALAAAFALVVVLYAFVGDAGADAVLHALRALLVPVAAYLLGRSLALEARDLLALGRTVVVTAAAVAAYGLVEVYAVPLDWWREHAVGWYREQLGFDYGAGLSGLPENFVFNPGDERPVRRLVSTFLSPLATAFMLAVALLFAAARPRLERLHVLVPVIFAGLLWTHSRSVIAALAGGLVVLALVLRRWWALGAAAAVLVLGAGFVAVFDEIGPRTTFTASELEVQRATAREEPGAEHDPFDPDEPSLASHWDNLRSGLERVGEHPEGSGLGTAGAVAKRFDEPLLAGESNYAEIGVQTGIAGLALFVAWNLALLLALARAGRHEWGAAATCASLAAVLALAIQTDAYGVPWLGYVVWSLGGALVGSPALLTRSEDRLLPRPSTPRAAS
jgi:hypothetical protein